MLRTLWLFFASGWSDRAAIELLVRSRSRELYRQYRAAIRSRS